jgi:hypothetical protein
MAEYTLTLTISVDEAQGQALIDIARRLYAASKGAFGIDENDVETRVPAEDRIGNAGDALAEILQYHPMLEEAGVEAGVEIHLMNWNSDEDKDTDPEEQEAAPGPVELDSTPSGSESETGYDDDLDEFDPGVYICRWPNGDFSVVTADTKREAIIVLDEWAGAHPSQLSVLDRFMADFTLVDDGEIVLNRFSDATDELIWDRCYPALRDLLGSDDVTDPEGMMKPGAAELVRRAVEHERSRLWDSQPKDEPRTEIGKRVAEQMGTSAVVADHYVEEFGKQILEHDDDETRKPN